VRDEGIGIAPQHQERIFQVFERLHTADSYPGTGIGLAIVKRGIARMGGTVRVESAPGKGSTFYLSLPAA
jgi:signal transduction histidine kinase